MTLDELKTNLSNNQLVNRGITPDSRVVIRIDGRDMDINLVLSGYDGVLGHYIVIEPRPLQI